MNTNDIAVGLDIGTTKIVAVIGRKNEHGKIVVLGMGKAKSLGVRGGVVNNITQTIESIEEAVRLAEADSGLKIKSVVAGIAGQHIRSLHHSDYITRPNPDEVIGDSDLGLLEENVNKLSMLPGEQIIHALPQVYKVDGQTNVREPRGMYGSRLEANFHIVVGQMASIKNIYRCIKDANLEVNRITLEPLASADAVLSDEEKEAGVVLVDIGGGTTDVAIFKDGIIRHTAVIPFGGNVVTEDIKEGCSIIERQAELLKIKFGSAWPAENKQNEIVSIPGLRGREPKEISLYNLSKIINARVVEIIGQVYMEIKNYGYQDHDKRLIAGIVLTGGGAQLKHIKQLVEFVTGMDTRIGYPNEHLAGDSGEELSSPLFATSIGLVIKGLEWGDPGAFIAANERVADVRAPEPEPEIKDEPEMASSASDSEIEIAEAERAEAKSENKRNLIDRWFENIRDFLDKN
jgi:cell division protein FtsA